MDYPVAARTLKKWAGSKLERRREDGAEHFIFSYDGSTCNNGGTPYLALMHVKVGDGGGDTVESAWIEIPEDQKEAASAMCAAPGTGAADAEPFFESLAGPADFIGRSLESVILEDVPLNYAGCFCGRPHVNQKWKIALSTVHYAIHAG